MRGTWAQILFLYYLTMLSFKPILQEQSFEWQKDQSMVYSSYLSQSPLTPKV